MLCTVLHAVLHAVLHLLQAQDIGGHTRFDCRRPIMGYLRLPVPSCLLHQDELYSRLCVQNKIELQTQSLQDMHADIPKWFLLELARQAHLSESSLCLCMF